MSQPESNTPTRADYMKTIQRCAEAYHHVRAELPANAGYHEGQRNQYKASLAFLAQLPLLYDPASFQLYIACIAQGVAVGAVDIVDAGRFCHIAQTAMSAWKLANLIVPAAQAKERAAQQKEARQQATPLPSKGNHDDGNGNQSFGKDLQHALENLPTFDVQKQHFQSLRNRGMVLPSDRELRDNPLAALHFCQIAEQLLRDEALAIDPPNPQAVSQPAPDPQQHSKQAA